jgi:hypothetical protein
MNGESVKKWDFYLVSLPLFRGRVREGAIKFF